MPYCDEDAIGRLFRKVMLDDEPLHEPPRALNRDGLARYVQAVERFESSLFTPSNFPPPPSALDLPPFLAERGKAAEYYRTLAYDAEHAGQLRLAEELRETARSIDAMDQAAFLRWYATSVHPRNS